MTVKVRILPPEVCANYELLPNEKLLSITLPHSSTHNKEGLVGILTVPPTSFLSEEELKKNPTSREKHYPPTHRLALILHGAGGHKNYCYQSLSAQELATKLGFYSFRFDFRGNGDSQEIENPKTGRTVAGEVDDLELVYGVFKHGALYKEIGINLIPNVIIGHSRGSTVMFQWAIKQHKKCEKGDKFQFVPNLINCSGRYRSRLLVREYTLQEEEEPWTVEWTQYRFGQYTSLPLAREELLDLSTQDFSGVKHLDPEIHVLSIYGLHDTIVPVDDSSCYANDLGSRHQLTFIHTADHNFYGTETIDAENEEEFNPEKLPLTKKRKVNFNYKVTDLITEWLHTTNDVQRFRVATQEIYYYPRWRNIDGISNFRDIGGWRTEDNKHYVRAGTIFRCANPSNVTELGKKQLKELGVQTFFDFRSLAEYERAGGLSIEGVETRVTPVFATEDMSPLGIARRYRNLLASWYTFKYVYENILRKGGEAFKTVFLYLRDHPDSTIAYNCTAGKDRTGMMTMLILLLLGVDHHTIAKEYELTTIGLLQDHPNIKKDLLETIAKLRNDLESEGHQDHLSNSMWELTPDEMFENLISSKYESMIATIMLFEKKFGGIENYCNVCLGLTDEDIKTIRDNLLVKSSPYPDQNSKWFHRSKMGGRL